MPEPDPTPATPNARVQAGDDRSAARFVALLSQCLADGSFVSLRLGRYRGARPDYADLDSVAVRRLSLRGKDVLSFVRHHATRDETHNLASDDGVAAVRDALRDGFEHAHLLTREHDIQWSLSRKGRPSLRRGRIANTPAASSTATTAHDAGDARLVAHDRAKRRYIDPGCAFLAELGVTDAQGAIVPAMARKWKQINKFVEVFDHALASSPLARQQHLRVVDFGCGKAYLTFAVHEHMSHALARDARVVGVELRADLVRQCAAIVQRLGLEGIAFEQGDVRSYAAGSIDIMIALHACDTATDHAIALGVRAGAAVIMCSPCCHTELRPQMRSPPPLAPLLQHGIHMAQEAEMVTDGLRALLLESAGYATRVFEFVSPEHTSKNKMILGVKREHAPRREQLLAQIEEIKAFYGVREQCLETLLAADRLQRETTQVQG